jgi:gliding motility-associated-like protein
MFTPNGDGINDDWGARLLTDGSPDDYRIEVFNQAGGKMYTSISLNNRWNGGDCPDGPYWYIIERKDTGERVKTGGVTIQR